MDYPDVDALPQDLKDTLSTHAPVNIYRMVMHSPGLAPGFFVMADAMFQANSLPAPLRELAILRVGYRYSAPYETHQHEMIAGYAGLSAEAISAAATGSTDGLPDDEVGILAWTDKLLDDHTLNGPDRDDALKPPHGDPTRRSRHDGRLLPTRLQLPQHLRGDHRGRNVQLGRAKYSL